MARRREPWVVISSRPTYWYYKLAPWDSYRSTGIRKRYSRAGKILNQRDAEEYAREQWQAHLARQETKPRARTLREMLEPYFLYYRCPHIARIRADRKQYSRRYAHEQRRRLEMYVFNDPLADKVATEITPGDLEDWKQRRLAAGVGVRTINMALNAISTAYHEEIHNNPRAIPYDPTAYVSPVAADTQEAGIYTLEELRRMFADPAAWGYSATHPGTQGNRAARDLAVWHAYAFALAHHQLGERPSALRQLIWGDIEDNILTLTRTKTRVPRAVPLPAQLQTALEEVRDRAIRIADDDLIWSYDDGSPRAQTWFRKRWNHMTNILQLPDTDPDGRRRTPYSLKRSLITHLVDAGADPILVREWVGHAHTSGERALTPAQARYKLRRSERLQGLRPMVEELLS